MGSLQTMCKAGRITFVVFSVCWSMNYGARSSFLDNHLRREYSMAFSREDELLIQCSRSVMSLEAKAKASLILDQPLDWDYLLKASIIHATAPLFYNGLSQMGRTRPDEKVVPEKILEELKRLHEHSRTRNERLFQVIHDVGKTFEEAGLEVMGLKDTQLAWEVYPEIGLRPMGDIDLLIHPENYQDVAKALGTLGFEPIQAYDLSYTVNYAWGLAFRRPWDGVWLDLQWNVLQREFDVHSEGNFNFQMERMWSNARAIFVKGTEIKVPNPEDMLFHLCLHLEGHVYAELILFCDIAEMVQAYQGRLNWTTLIEMARKYSSESSVYYVLLLTNRLFQTPIPAYVFEELKPSYFMASLFDGLYGNLATLHLSLDDIRHKAFPTQEVMGHFEEMVREQAVSSMTLYREMDTLVSTFIKAGGTVVVLNEGPSERIFPERLLRPFEAIHGLILDQDFLAMQTAFGRCGFKLKKLGGNLIFQKVCPIRSKDPVLAHRDLSLELEGSLQQEDHYHRQFTYAGGKSKKVIALDLIKKWILNREKGPGGQKAEIKIMALSPEDMVLALCSYVSTRSENRLFGAVCGFQFFENYQGPLDWGKVMKLARARGLTESLGEALPMISALLGNRSFTLPDLKRLGIPEGQPPRMLEVARYGPSTLEQYPAFKRLFFSILSFFSLDGLRSKARYFLGPFVGYERSRSVLPNLVIETGMGLLSLMRKDRYDPVELAYWTWSEPNSREKTFAP